MKIDNDNQYIKEYSYRFEIISTVSNSFAFDAKSSHEEGMAKFINDLLSVFVTIGDDGEVKLEVIQEHNETLNKKISNFIETYSTNWPELKGVKAQIEKIPIGKFFCFLPKNTMSDARERLTIRNILLSKNDGLIFEELEKASEEAFGNLIENYSVTTFGCHRLRIGEHDRNKRFCRFCQKKAPEVKFKNKAHAISESLGNKHLVLLDECDDCNGRFSKAIEPDIVQYLSLFRTIYGVKAKGGAKGLKEKNFTFENDPNLVLTLKNAIRPTEPILPYKITLNYDQKMNLQNIYRCLCKYFLSVIKTDDLAPFSETIKWINNESSISQLPFIAELIDYRFFCKEPELLTFIRKKDNGKLPYAIGEFRFTCKRMIFILPLVNALEVDFTAKENYDYFWNHLPHLKLLEGVSFMDYSNDTARDLVLNLSGQLANQAEAP
ncbi:MAG: HNH endonuclease [Bacteroidia bacterium]|nr:HNH endonuclease [Bacteroidia bacterium]